MCADPPPNFWPRDQSPRASDIRQSGSFHFAPRMRDARELDAHINASLAIRASTLLQEPRRPYSRPNIQPGSKLHDPRLSFHAGLRRRDENAPDFRNHLLHTKLPTKSMPQFWGERLEFCTCGEMSVFQGASGKARDRASSSARGPNRPCRARENTLGGSSQVCSVSKVMESRRATAEAYHLFFSFKAVRLRRRPAQVMSPEGCL
jgi:hypothetical protein